MVIAPPTITAMMAKMALPGDAISALASDITLTIGLATGAELISGLDDDGYAGVTLVALIGLLLVSAVGIALLMWRLSTGPLSLGVLTPYVAAALTMLVENGNKEAHACYLQRQVVTLVGDGPCGQPRRPDGA